MVNPSPQNTIADFLNAVKKMYSEPVGFNLGNANYLLGIIPAHSRGRFIGIANTLVGVAVFTPVLVGFLADARGYSAVFAVGAVLYALTWWRAGTLRRDL